MSTVIAQRSIPRYRVVLERALTISGFSLCTQGRHLRGDGRFIPHYWDWGIHEGGYML
jgi:hypothetical protein